MQFYRDKSASDAAYNAAGERGWFPNAVRDRHADRIAPPSPACFSLAGLADVGPSKRAIKSFYLVYEDGRVFLRAMPSFSFHNEISFFGVVLNSPGASEHGRDQLLGKTNTKHDAGWIVRK